MFGIAERLRDAYREYPRTFWALTAAGFIDTIGGTLLFPFFALYVTQRFGVGHDRGGPASWAHSPSPGLVGGTSAAPSPTALAAGASCSSA